jgi:hypothetical protein
LDNELFLHTQTFVNLIIDRATGGVGSEPDYQKLRGVLISNDSTKTLCPDFIKTNRSLSQFWQFIKHKFGSYQERRQFIWDSFAPLLNELEGNTSTPAEDSISAKLQQVDSTYIHSEWKKALQRKLDDPEAAITSARSLIESVCKFILDNQQISYADDAELPKLYKATANSLNLAPDQHHEQIFKQILSGCHTVVEGLGSMRNKLSDSHGKSTKQVRPASRHAELAVNLSGAMSTFLLDTYEQRNAK